MNITRRHAYAMLAGASIVLGTGGLVHVASAAERPAPMVQHVAAPGGQDDDGGAEGNEATEAPEAQQAEGPDAENGSEVDDTVTYVSSITIPDPAEATNDSTDDSTEQATLASLATVTPEEATAAALKSLPGTLVTIELDNEDGNVVYSVEIDTGTGTVDVKIDAGNATVLDTQVDDGTDSEGADEAQGTDATVGSAPVTNG